ncbi:hypothetical protein NA57DRAFT_52471 [Rhizodiscina lignyota]|uniref:Uncharacterized protein n=1 Tax=Rhizodiscina lignyota TaxID=1504668 RepID=A0A9P4MCY7_9PEZI|nr:hypothetical protein NA57DRAFT_52471 [Rhizodiscina lignyota]
MGSTTKDLPSNLSNLHISTAPTAIPKAKAKSKPADVADSWEDEADHDATTPTNDPSTETSEDSSPVIGLSRHSTNFDPHPPPPTPASPSAHTFSYSDLDSHERFPHLAQTTSTNSTPSTPSAQPPSRSVSARSPATGSPTASGRSTPARPDRRPDKTMATASRLIAAGLGVKAPRRTEAEREYDRVAREAERKRREKEKEEVKRAEEEKQKAKQSVWED